MAYDEQSFLNGLAAGLSVTGGQPLGAWLRQLTSGTSRVGDYRWPEGAFDTFVSKITFRTRAARTVEYEYGPVGGEHQNEFRRVQPSTQLQTFYHVIRIPQAVPMPEYYYGAYFYEPQGALTDFDAYFMAFPYHVGGRDFLYPGAPEQVDVWMMRGFRGFEL